ncbi:MAG: trimethylamine methyltransferase family protein [Gammaproteobacteria bacterium]|nr:trimethylamine methyltransferase family protein [Gammaproteobacteria bacterium]
MSDTTARDTPTSSERRARRGARAARRRERMSAPLVMLPTLERKIPLYEVLNEEGVELVHEASMRILEEVGIDFRDDEALAIWREAGADVQGQRVRMDRALLLGLVAQAPEVYTLHGRNPERTVRVGGPYTVFAPTYGSPFVLDFEGERRYSTLEDLYNFLKLAHLSPALHLSGGIVCEPVDLPVSRRHLHVAYGCLRYSDKPFMGATTARERAEDTLAMARMVMGEEFVAKHTVMTSVTNCNSPLVWDATMLDALKVYARANQAVLVSPFVLAGANTPASSVGAVAQLNAEALAGVAFGQLVRPGSPMVYGQFTATVSMRSGAPMAGTPEICLMNYMIGQMARRYRLPWRSSGMNAGSKLVDAQAAYESNMTMHAVLLAGANFVFHAAGWLEAGLSASYAKFVLDAEQMEMYYRYAQGAVLDDFAEAMEAVREVGPGGHYLGTAHTQAHFQSAFFIPELLDNNNYEQWLLDGSKDANTRALEKARGMLGQYEEPGLDPAVDEALRAFIREREAQLPETLS